MSRKFFYTTKFHSISRSLKIKWTNNVSNGGCHICEKTTAKKIKRYCLFKMDLWFFERSLCNRVPQSGWWTVDLSRAWTTMIMTTVVGWIVTGLRPSLVVMEPGRRKHHREKFVNFNFFQQIRVENRFIIQKAKKMAQHILRCKAIKKGYQFYWYI